MVHTFREQRPHKEMLALGDGHLKTVVQGIVVFVQKPLNLVADSAGKMADNEGLVVTEIAAVVEL